MTQWRDRNWFFVFGFWFSVCGVAAPLPAVCRVLPAPAAGCLLLLLPQRARSHSERSRAAAEARNRGLPDRGAGPLPGRSRFLACARNDDLAVVAPARSSQLAAHGLRPSAPARSVQLAAAARCVPQPSRKASVASTPNARRAGMYVAAIATTKSTHLSRRRPRLTDSVMRRICGRSPIRSSRRRRRCPSSASVTTSSGTSSSAHKASS